jgi:hypothetical protein
MFLGVESGRHVRLTTSVSSMSRLSRQCGVPSISQPYRPLLPVTGIALSFTFLYEDDVRTSQEIGLHGLV